MGARALLSVAVGSALIVVLAVSLSNAATVRMPADEENSFLQLAAEAKETSKGVAACSLYTSRSMEFKGVSPSGATCSVPGNTDLNLQQLTVMGWVYNMKSHPGASILGNFVPSSAALPAKCSDIIKLKEAAGLSAVDGEYDLFWRHKRAGKFKAYCHNMGQGNPTEYITLPHQSGYANTGSVRGIGGSVVTKWKKIRIDPDTLEVNTKDFTFAQSNGSYKRLTDLGLGTAQGGAYAIEKTFDAAIAYGTAMGCCASTDSSCPNDSTNHGASANIDLSGTVFGVEMAEGQSFNHPTGKDSEIKGLEGATGNHPQKITLKGVYGHCGTYGPSVTLKLTFTKAVAHNEDNKASGYGLTIGAQDTVVFNVGTVQEDFSSSDADMSAAAGTKVSAHMDANEWHHVAGTFDGSKLTLIIDGVAKGELDAEGQVHYAKDNLFFVGRGRNTYFHGQVAEVAVYNYAMSVDEVKKLYKFPQEGTERGMKAYWHFTNSNPNQQPGQTKNSPRMDCAVSGSLFQDNPWPCSDNQFGCKRLEPKIKAIFHNVASSTGVPVQLLQAGWGMSSGGETLVGHSAIKQKMGELNRQCPAGQASQCKTAQAECAKHYSKHMYMAAKRTSSALAISLFDMLKKGQVKADARRFYMTVQRKKGVSNRFETMRTLRALFGMKGESVLDRHHREMNEFKEAMYKKLGVLRRLQGVHGKMIIEQNTQIERDRKRIDQDDDRLGQMDDMAEELRTKLTELAHEIQAFWTPIEQTHADQAEFKEEVARVDELERKENHESQELLRHDLKQLDHNLKKELDEMKAYTAYQEHVMSDQINKTHSYVDHPLTEAITLVRRLEKEHDDLRSEIKAENQHLKSSYLSDFENLKRDTEENMYQEVERVGRSLDRSIEGDVRQMVMAAKQWMRHEKMRERQEKTDPGSLAKKLSDNVRSLVKQGMDVKRATQTMESVIDKNADEMTQLQDSVLDQWEKQHHDAQTAATDTLGKLKKLEDEYQSMQHSINEMMVSSTKKAQRTMKDSQSTLEQSTINKQTEMENLLNGRLSDLTGVLTREMDKSNELSMTVQNLEAEMENSIGGYLEDVHNDRQNVGKLEAETRNLAHRIPSKEDIAAHEDLVRSKMLRICRDTASHMGRSYGKKIGDYVTQKALAWGQKMVAKSGDVCKGLKMME